VKITIRHVVAQHRVVDAVVIVEERLDDHRIHHVGHLPTEGWFCSCGYKRCAAIERVRELVVIMDDPAGERDKETP
jgi:hypothetical protein